MERVYAFTDEYGQFSWELNKQDISSCFIISAIIVKESELNEYESGAEAIRKRYFQAGEIKSNKVGSNPSRRKKILNDLVTLPFQFFSVVIDKQTCLDNMNMRGLLYKKTFYKFMNNIVYKELRQAFQILTIVADTMGTNDYMESFCRYVEERQDVANLLGEAKFVFHESIHDVKIQVADFISGTLARYYDTKKKEEEATENLHILQGKVIRIEEYPKTFRNYSLESSALASEYDKDIAALCYSRAVTYLNNNKADEDEYAKGRDIVLKYLLFRFMNNDSRGYIPTYELQKQLEYTSLKGISDQVFRSKIIGRLRDEKVIIASSNKGYKIPGRLREVMDYVQHDARVVMPMLSRLKNCRDLVKLSTVNQVDLLDGTDFERLRWYFDNYPPQSMENELSETSYPEE